MRTRGLAAVASLALVAAACGGGDSGGPQTEEGAVEAVLRAQRGALTADADAVIGFMSADCREIVDEDDVRLGLGLVVALLGSEVDLDKIEVTAEIEEYSGDTAEVRVEYVAPEESDLDDLFFEPTTVETFYEDGKWVGADCEFGDDSEQQASQLEDDLAAAGFAATRDDPAPAGTAVPVGKGFTVSVDSIDTDAYEAVREAGGFSNEPDAGNQLVMIEVTIGYSGSEEPVSVSDVRFQGVGGASAVGVDFYGCSGMDGELDTYGTSLLSGGVTSGAICGEVPSGDIAGMVLNVGPNFSDNTVFIDPAATAASPTAVTGASGPAADGDLTDDRNDPIAVGTATDIGEGWTLTVNGLNPDAAGTIAVNDFNQPAPAGSEYVLVDVTLGYEGEETASASFVSFFVAGDSNLATRSGTCSVSWDGELDRFADVFDGATLSGELCFLVDSADIGSIQLLASTGFGEQPDVFALS